MGFLDLLLGVGEAALFAAELVLAVLLLGELAVQVLFLLDHPLLQGRDILAPDLDRLVELGPGGEHLLLGLDRSLAKLRLSAAGGLRQDAVRLAPNVLAFGNELLPEKNVSDDRDRSGKEEACRDRDREVFVHSGSPSRGRRSSRGRLHDEAEVSSSPRTCDC